MNGSDVNDPETSIRNEEESREPEVTNDENDSDGKAEICAQIDDEKDKLETSKEDKVNEDEEAKLDTSIEDETDEKYEKCANENTEREEVNGSDGKDSKTPYRNEVTNDEPDSDRKTETSSKAEVSIDVEEGLNNTNLDVNKEASEKTVKYDGDLDEKDQETLNTTENIDIIKAETENSDKTDSEEEIVMVER